MLKRITLLSVLLVACIALVAMAAHHRRSTQPIAQADLPAGIHYKVLKDTPTFKAGLYTSGGTPAIVTIISKSLSQNYNSFPSLSNSVTGSQAPTADFYLSSGGSQTLSDVIGNISVANLNMLTIWSDQLDATVSCGTTSAFGTSAGTLSVPQGKPFEWDSYMGTSQLPLTSWQSFTVSAGTIGTLSGGTAATTLIHLRGSVHP